MLLRLRNSGKLVLFRLVIAGLALPLAASAGVDEELAQAAKSPYDIARFVDTHLTYRWEPLWKALGLENEGDVFIRPCGESSGRRGCFEELITVLDPFQVILTLRHNLVEQEVYLRFLRTSGPDNPGPWTFGGYYSPLVKYFEPRHRTVRFGTKPFLVVTRQGVSGSGLSSEVEDWMDLTLPKFEPVFSLTTEGHREGSPDRIGLETNGSVVSMESDPVEGFQVVFGARFMYEQEWLGYRVDTAVYVRRGDDFVYDATRSETPKADIDNIYNLEDDRPSNEDYLRYLLPELKKIAAGPQSETKDWLKRFLKECENTVEKREIQALLTAAPQN
jgi:hypothetical protein